MMFSRIELHCPFTEEIGRRLAALGDFYSVFFNSIGHGPASDDLAPLPALLQSEQLAKAVPTLLPVNLQAASDFATLNRYEFEGSLVGALLQGTCTQDIVCDEREAIEAARKIIQETVLRPNGNLQAVRMNNPSWSALTNQATLSWAYFVFEPTRHLVWFVCFAEEY